MFTHLETREVQEEIPNVPDNELLLTGNFEGGTKDDSKSEDSSEAEEEQMQRRTSERDRSAPKKLTYDRIGSPTISNCVTQLTEPDGTKKVHFAKTLLVHGNDVTTPSAVPDSIADISASDGDNNSTITTPQRKTTMPNTDTKSSVLRPDAMAYPSCVQSNNPNLDAIAASPQQTYPLYGHSKNNSSLDATMAAATHVELPSDCGSPNETAKDSCSGQSVFGRPQIFLDQSAWKRHSVLPIFGLLGQGGILKVGESVGEMQFEQLD